MRKVLVCALVATFCVVLFFQVFLSDIKKEERVAELEPSLAKALCQMGIVNNKPIAIPGHPHAFNPSLIPYRDGYLLSFRVRHRASKKETNGRHRDISFIGVALLDKKFNVSKKSVQLLDIASYSSQVSLTAEDARLLNYGKRVFIFFNDFPPSKIQGEYALYFGELIEDKGMFVLKEPAKLLNYSHAIHIEKNWSPFLSDGKLYFIYSDQPRVVLEVDVNTGNCKEVSRAPSNLNWNWGEVRGGTPACLINDKLLTFFHSSIPVASSKKGAEKKNGLNYVMGAYTFDKDPPFSIHAITPVPSGRLEDYTKNNRHKVVFPSGLVIEEDYIHVAWGKNNSRSYTTFDKKNLLDSLKTCR